MTWRGRFLGGCASLCLFAAIPSVAPAAADQVPGVEQRATWTPADPQEPEKACPKAVWPAANTGAPAPGRGQRVLVIGDSLTKYSYRPLQSRLTAHGWLPTIVCWGGTQTDWGLTQARDVQQRRYLPERVVVAFGTNDVHKNPCSTRKSCRRQVARFAGRVERLLQFLGPQRQVWWLNIDMDAQRAARALGEPWNTNYPAFNAELARRLSGHPNAHLIDWHSIVGSSKRPIRYTWDGLHYDPVERPRASVGTMLRVRTVVAALDTSC